MVGRVAFYLHILFLVTIRAALVNVTIDDTDGDSVTHQLPVYQPASPWGGPSCVGCDIVPNPSLAFDGTWHAATYHPQLLNVNITFSFTGVSIWVFFILANANKFGTGVTSNTECNFTLDGQLVGYFNHQPNESTNSLQYNAMAFSANSLNNSQHELVISTNDLPYSAYLNFDYAIYAVDIPDSASASRSEASSTGSATATSSTTGSAQLHSLSSAAKLGIIVGCVLGGLIFIVLGAVLVYFRRLRKTEKIPPSQQRINAFHRKRPQSYPDNRTMSGDSLQWQSSICTDRPGQGTFNDQHSHIRSPSSDLASEVTSFVPVRREYQPLHVHSTKSRDELRIVRQMEIDQRLQSAQREMYNLALRQSMQGGHSSTTSDFGRSEAEEEMVAMREQIRQLKTQIEQLQAERSSDWAQGLSDAPPPAYN